MAPKGYSQHEFFYLCPIPTGMPIVLLMTKPISPALVQIAKTDQQRAQENPDITDKDLPLGVISQDDE